MLLSTALVTSRPVESLTMPPRPAQMFWSYSTVTVTVPTATPSASPSVRPGSSNVAMASSELENTA